jgi:hypothetical protein
MRSIFCAAILSLCLFQSAKAEEFDINWFVRNTAARMEALQLCRDDYRKVQSPRTGPICANAEAAQTRLFAREQGSAFGLMDRPAYWVQNPEMSQSVLTACARRASYDQHLLRYCNVVRTAQSMR